MQTKSKVKQFYLHCYVHTVKANRPLVDGDDRAPCSLTHAPDGIFLNRFDLKDRSFVVKCSSPGKYCKICH